MRKVSYIVGFFAAFLLAIGILARILHIPGSDLCLLLGCIALIFASTFTFAISRKNKTSQSRLLKIRITTGYIAAILLSSGTALKQLHLMLANVQIVVGSALLIFIFLPLYFYELYAQNITLEEKVAARTKEIIKAMDNLNATQQQLISANQQSEEARKKSDELLLNILPAEVAEELKASGSSAARQFDDVTVIFTDFVNFTRASELHTPQQIVSELDTCFKAFDEIISKYQIEKIKTVGDAYLAAAGLPTQNEEHALHIVAAAIEIGEYMRNRKAKLGDATFDVRIGIHSGCVVAGIVGIKKFAYDIWGDTVNIAARMEQNSEPGKINISETTYDLVKDKFTCTCRGEVQAKNKGMLKMYFIEGAVV